MEQLVLLHIAAGDSESRFDKSTRFNVLLPEHDDEEVWSRLCRVHPHRSRRRNNGANGEVVEHGVQRVRRLSFCVHHGGDGSDVSKLVGLDTHMCGYSRGDISIQ